MREYISINGNLKRLSGEVRVNGAKNAALPILFATLLTDETCVLENVPNLEDISVTLRLLSHLGAKSNFQNKVVEITSKDIISTSTPYSLVKQLRASFWALGPLLARTGFAKVALPGGDAIGTRPVDLHIKGLKTMGAEIRMKHGAIIAHAPGGLNPSHIVLDFPSVGATHNLLMATSLTPGVSIIDGAAKEPEVIELVGLLKKMGAEIEGEGTSSIRVKGKEKLKGAKVFVLGDRIEAATYLIAGLVTGGEVKVSGIYPEALSSTLEILENMGGKIKKKENSISIKGTVEIKPVTFQTAPYPGLATDVQPLLMAALAKAKGTSSIKETVFENRFTHVGEYRRLGANISISSQVALVRGVETLSAAPVDATDIRAAAGLVILALQAEGRTDIFDIYHLDRGYDDMVEKLKSLGADIKRKIERGSEELVFGC